MAEIGITNRAGVEIARVLVDEVDLEWASQYRWSLGGGGGYAVRGTCRGDRHNPVRRTYLMHRELMGLAHGDPRQVDHKNGDGLDNRRENLRVATHRENHQNLHADRGGTSKHRGVSWDTRSGKWVARANNHHLGYFSDEEQAAAVAADWRRRNMPFSREAAA